MIIKFIALVINSRAYWKIFQSISFCSFCDGQNPVSDRFVLWCFFFQDDELVVSCSEIKYVFLVICCIRKSIFFKIFINQFDKYFSVIGVYFIRIVISISLRYIDFFLEFFIIIFPLKMIFVVITTDHRTK